MPKSLKAKFWPDSHSHVDAAGSRSRPSGSDRGPHPAKALASTEASFDAAGDESRTKYYPYVEEPSVQPSVAAGEDQGRPCHVHGLRENNTRLAKSLAEDRASSQILPPELYDLEKCNGRLQRTSDAYAESSQPLQETWNSCTVSRPRNASKLPQNEAAYLRQELQVLKVTQSPSKGTMEAIEVPLDRLAARQQQIQACNTEIPPRQNNTDQHQNDLQNQLAFAQRKAQAFEAEVLRMRSYEQDLHETRAILAASEQELRECKDDLFRLQPVTQATDADILRDFQSLCQRINDWIESEISFFEEAHPNVEPRQMFSASRSPEMNNLMQKYPDVGEYQIRKMIHNGLQKIMFDRDVYLFGMPLGLVQTLQKAEQSMAMLEPRREYTTIDTWRSETLNAISADEDFANQRRRHLEETSQDLFKNLSSAFPVISWKHQSFTRFYKKVMSPAADLASMIQTSTSIYDFDMPKDIVPDSVPVHFGHLPAYRLIEVRTGQTLKSSSKVVPDSHGFIGKVLLPLEPELQRRNRGHVYTTLHQACYLVKLDKPLLKGNKALV